VGSRTLFFLLLSDTLLWCVGNVAQCHVGVLEDSVWFIFDHSPNCPKLFSSLYRTLSESLHTSLLILTHLLSFMLQIVLSSGIRIVTGGQ